MKHIVLIMIGLVTGCATTIKNHEETKECMNYRSMMTAPMPPHAMKDLQKACDDSMNRQDKK